MISSNPNKKKHKIVDTIPQAIQSPTSAHSITSSQQQQQYPTSTQPRTRMITFIDQLYSRFKLLNKLSEQESNNFQTEVIQMLIDQNQCVDHQLYQETVQQIGLGTFVLEVLGAVVQKRNKFKNQYQMNRNLEEITKDLEKQRLDLTKKKKQLDKRQLGIKKKQQELLKAIKDKANQIEQKTKSTLLNIQQETKKRIKTLSATLKSKQKQLLDKATSLKQSLTKLNDLQTKQTTIQQKLKLLQRKEKQRKSKQATEKQQLIAAQQNARKLSQMKAQITNLQETNKKLEDDISRLNKKLKTNEMAYRHLKDETDKKLAKYCEVSERMKMLEDEKEKIREEREKVQEEVNESKVISKKMKRQVQKLEKEVNRLQKANKSLQSSIVQLSKQNQALTSKLQTQQSVPQSKSIPPPSQNIFQQLDISKIQDPVMKTQQHNFMMTDRESQQIPAHQQDFNDDMSILHNVAESIIVMESKEIDNDLNDLSRTVDIQKQIINWERLDESGVEGQKEDGKRKQQQQSEDEEESQDFERQRNYLMNMKKPSQKATNIPTIKNQPNKKTYSTKNSKKQKITQLNQQHQPSSQQDFSQSRQLINLQQSSFLHQKSSKNINESNIALFDNYFASQPSKEKPAKNIASNKLIAKSPHNQLLQQINAFAQSNPCQTLNSLNKQSLLRMVKQISSTELKFSRTVVEPFLQFILIILQPCSCPAHQKSLTLLFTHDLIIFLQEVFLKFEAIVKEIQEKSVIILSRILLSYQSHKDQQEQREQPEKYILKEKYLKSLKVKLLLEKDEFIKSNLKFLMEYE